MHEEDDDCLTNFRLRSYREQLGLSVIQFVELVNISQGVYMAYEEGVKKPTEKHATLLAEIVGCDVEDLFPPKPRRPRKTKTADDEQDDEDDEDEPSSIRFTDSWTERPYRLFDALPGEQDDAMEDLTDEQRRVIKLRFGLDGGRSRTLKQIAFECEVSEQEASNLLNDALMVLSEG